MVRGKDQCFEHMNAMVRVHQPLQQECNLTNYMNVI
jgi:hypothetical protein